MSHQPLTAEAMANKWIHALYNKYLTVEELQRAFESYAAQEVAKVSTNVHAAGPDLLDALEHCLNAMALGETPRGWTDYESWCASLREGKQHKEIV